MICNIGFCLVNQIVCTANSLICVHTTACIGKKKNAAAAAAAGAWRRTDEQKSAQKTTSKIMLQCKSKEEAIQWCVAS